MSLELMNSMFVSAAGMHAQSIRLRVISENVANADSDPAGPDAEPYRRKLVTFRNQLDRELGVDLVEVKKIKNDKSDFKWSYEPNHPYANAEGYIRKPNVNALIEMMDMKEAQRSYEANLNVIDTSRTMMQRTVDMLRS